jgi:hypothetical protein
MSVTAWKLAGTGANVGGANNLPWSNLTYIYTDDTNYASCALNTKNLASDALLATNFGFSASDIPAGSTINGFEWIIAEYGSSAITHDNTLKLYANGLVGSNMASTSAWPVTDITEVTYGGATQMCGTTLTQSGIVASTFGVSLSVQNNVTVSDIAYVDYIKIRVYYTEGGGGGVVVPVLAMHYNKMRIK